MFAHLPGVVDKRGMILAAAFGNAAIKPSTNLLQYDLLRSGEAWDGRVRAKRASARWQSSYVVRQNQNELSIAHFSGDCWVRSRIPARVCPSGIELWNCKLPSRKGGAVVGLGKLPVIPEAQRVLGAQEVENLCDIALQALGTGVVRFQEAKRLHIVRTALARQNLCLVYNLGDVEEGLFMEVVPAPGEGAVHQKAGAKCTVIPHGPVARPVIPRRVRSFVVRSKRGKRCVVGVRRVG